MRGEREGGREGEGEGWTDQPGALPLPTIDIALEGGAAAWRLLQVRQAGRQEREREGQGRGSTPPLVYEQVAASLWEGQGAAPPPLMPRTGSKGLSSWL